MFALVRTASVANKGSSDQCQLSFLWLNWIVARDAGCLDFFLALFCSWSGKQLRGKCMSLVVWKNSSQTKSSSREQHTYAADCYCNRVKKLRNYMLLWNLCKRWQFSGTIYFETNLLAHKSVSSCWKKSNSLQHQKSKPTTAHTKSAKKMNL